MLSKKDQDRIFAEVDSLKDELVQVICDTVRIPSVTPGFGREQEISKGGETRVNLYMEPIMKETGMETDLWEEETGRANLVGVYKGNGEGRSLLFNGHVDVVPAGDEKQWTQAAPWSGEVKKGLIWGRGSADMKSGNAAAIYGLKALLKAGFRPKGDVLIEHVVGEECMNTEAGTGAALKRGYRADAGIVVEPTTYMGRLNVCPAAPGVAAMVCSVEGKPVHACMYDELIRPGGQGSAVGVSALDKGLIVCQAMKELGEQWGQSKVHPMFKRPGHFTVGATFMQSGVGGSVIPENMTMEYGFFHDPRQKLEDLKQEVSAFLTRYISYDVWLREHPPKCDWVFYWPGYDLKSDEPICQTLATATKAVDQECGEIYGFPAVNDAAFINAAGIPTVSMGPGELRVGHSSREYVPIQDVVDAAKAYALAIAEWCGV